MVNASLFPEEREPVPEETESTRVAQGSSGMKSTQEDFRSPLAERMRPQSLAAILGQDHLLGPGGTIQLAIMSRRPHSMILWGPPGVGKTTIARLLADEFDLAFATISAVLGGVKEIREAVVFAQQQRPRGTLVFVDEVHRFNKSQQDAFLPHVESGLFTFVGATTENPSFEVNSALLSRAAVYVLRRLDAVALRALAERALALAWPGVTVADDGFDLLVETADGDGRRLLNLIDVLIPPLEAPSEWDGGLLPGADPGTAMPGIAIPGIAIPGAAVPRTVGIGPVAASHLDRESIARRLGERVRQFDQGGDAFYDQISALHKSVRGSSPDASLYWLARMLDGGADPRYLARRLVRMAAEDIGLADPRALRLALDAAETWERLGSPEGDLALAMAVTYLAVAPKSNAVYTAWKGVQAFVREHGSHPVPEHLRNAPTKLMSDLGYGRTYRYAHDEPQAYAAGESYLPEGLGDPVWYAPTDRGLEGRIQEKLDRLRALDEAHRQGSDPVNPATRR